MTGPTLPADSERVELWGRRIPRLLTKLARWIQPVSLVIVVFAAIDLASAERPTPPGGLPAYLRYALAVVGVQVLASALDQTATALRRRFLPPTQAGFQGLGPIEIPSWRATRLEYWPLVVGVVMTPAFLYLAIFFLWIAREGAFPFAIALAAVFAVMGPVMIGHGLRQRRRFRAWKRQRTQRS